MRGRPNDGALSGYMPPHGILLTYSIVRKKSKSKFAVKKKGAQKTSWGILNTGDQFFYPGVRILTLFNIAKISHKD